MASRAVPKLPGMRDVTSEAYRRVAHVVDSLTACFRQGGFQRIDTPLLEETELFVRKSGGELASQLFSFAGPGGTMVSLRPEFTSSVIRYFVHGRDSLELPSRFYYSGPVFRFGSGLEAGYHQFTQVGAELLGAGGVEADSEAILMAWEGLERVGLRGQRLRVGHVGVLKSVLDSYGLSEPTLQLVIGNMQGLKSSDGPAELAAKAHRIGLVGAGPGDGRAAGDGGGGEVSRALIEDVLMQSTQAAVGRRTTEDIASRLLREARGADDLGVFDAAVNLLASLCRLEGHPQEVLDRARGIGAARGVGEDSFDQLDSLVGLLDDSGLPEAQLTLDLGLVRGMGYYTGVIFELEHPGTGRGVSLGGGGRYDDLVRALGCSEEIPALGFAYDAESVVEALNGARPGRSD